jgi:NAD(P)H-nitrite reductase large subunit
MKYVILGNGIAGISAAETIRRHDPQGRIILVGDETALPYCRPMISLVLEGAVPPDKLPIRSSDFYESLQIQPVLGQRVIAVDVDGKSVRTSDGHPLDFDKLLIATGADPRPIKAQGLELENISYMRTENHVLGMLKALPAVRKALVLGGGLVGFKAAYGLMRRGIEVTMLIRSGYPLSMQVDEPAGDIILEELKRHGLDVHVNLEALAFEGQGRVRAAHLSDGREIPCDLVVIGKGVMPALSFVPRDRIEVDLGIRVDGTLQTSCPDIYAAGDVAEYVDVARNTPWVNAIWPEAVTQGRLAGMNMAGRKVVYRGSLSRNVIRIFGLDIMAGGIVNPPRDSLYQAVVSGGRRQNRYRKLVFQGNTLVGMVLVNDIEQGGVLLSLIQNRIPVNIPRQNLLDRGFNFSRLLWRPAA